MPITREQIAAEAPEVLAAIQADAASAERERIQSVEAQAIPGHDKLINTLKFDGKSTAADAAMAVLAAERNSRTSAAAALASDAPAPVPASAAKAVADAPGGDAAGNTAKTYAGFPVDPDSSAVDTKARAHMAAHPGTSYLDAVKAITANSR